MVRRPRGARYSFGPSKFVNLPSKIINVSAPIASLWSIDESELTKILQKNQEDSYTALWERTHLLSDYPDIFYYTTLKIVDEFDAKMTFHFGKRRDPDILGEVKGTVTFSCGDSDEKFAVVYDDLNYSCIISRFSDRLKSLLVNGKLVIKMEGALSFVARVGITKIEFGGDEIGESLFQQDDKDVELMVEKKALKIHRCVLDIASPAFHGLSSPIVIDDYKYEVVEMAVEAIYRLQVDDTAVENKIELLKFFNHYHLEDQKGILESHLIDELTTYNLCVIANAAVTAKAAKLRYGCMEYLATCHGKHPCMDFDKLDKEFVIKFFETQFRATMS